MCYTWDSKEGLLQVYNNGQHLETEAMNSTKCLRPKGSLVLGYLHKNQGGSIIVQVNSGFIGNLYYFQMWDRVLKQEELMNCSQGNVVSWNAGHWDFDNIIPVTDHHLRCGECLALLSPGVADSERRFAVHKINQFWRGQ